jgi:LAO/AO transport system kinase
MPEVGRATGDSTVSGVAELVEGARQGVPRAVARLITLVENEAPQRRDVAAALAPDAGHARVVGLTGPPGVGKSTITSALVGALRAQGRRVGVLAIDPSSPLSGGALLGDRIRMGEHAGDDGVFIRSLASRGRLGGLSAAVPQALRVLDAARFDVALVETVGVGQSEIDIAALADTTVLLLAPGLGDGIQAAKAGVIEVADVLVVNKADRDGAAQVARDLRAVQSLRPTGSDEWRPPIVSTVAPDGQGIDELVAALDRHWEWSGTGGQRERRRTARAAAEIEAIALAALRERFADVTGAAAVNAAATRVVRGELDPYAAADALVARL